MLGNSQFDCQVPSIERTTLDVDCAAMLAGDVTELRKASELVKVRPKVPIYEETYLDWTKNCTEFRTRRGYVQVGYYWLATLQALSDPYCQTPCLWLCLSVCPQHGLCRIDNVSATLQSLHRREPRRPCYMSHCYSIAWDRLYKKAQLTQRERATAVHV